MILADPLAEVPMRPDPDEAYNHFTTLMHHSASLRRYAVRSWLAAIHDPAQIRAMDEALNALGELEQDLDIDTSYERQEFEKDIAYLEEGPDALRRLQRERLATFETDVRAVTDYLAGLERCHFITDRDGTVNNYCARYLTSVQSAYNAIYLTIFARNRTARSILLTSAPLEPEGILEVTTMPADAYLIAGSKGREFRAPNGQHHRMAVPEAAAQALAAVNDSVAALLREKRFQPFARIGSGFQRKLGESTVGYRTSGGGQSAEVTESFRTEVRAAVRRADPDESTLRIEDTGYDLEIVATRTDGQDVRSFTKADGVRFITESIALDLAARPALVCGDTRSDLPMMQYVAERAPSTRVILVTTNRELADEAHSRIRDLLVVATPDALVSALYALGSAA